MLGMTVVMDRTVIACRIVRLSLVVAVDQRCLTLFAEGIEAFDEFLIRGEQDMQLLDIACGQLTVARDERENAFDGRFLVVNHGHDALCRLVPRVVRNECRVDAVIDH